ncbi:MAG: hypothetical protein SF123_03045 [Chloroflexota bacterium]|nr:hypothetical protein [Chloroflexota bacterium]
MRRLLKMGFSIALGLMVLGDILISEIAIAQDETPIATETRPIFVMQNDQITQWNFDLLQSRLVIELGANVIGTDGIAVTVTPALQSTAHALDRSQTYAYRVDIIPQITPPILQPGRLVRANLQTNNEEVLFEHTNIMGYSVSPQGDKVAIIYWEGVYLETLPRVCMLEIVTQQCSEVAMAVTNGEHSTTWLDDTTFAILSLARKVTLVDATTLQVTTLQTSDDLDITSFTLIPNTHQFLLAINRYSAPPLTPVEFYALDRDTQAVSLFRFGSVFDPAAMDGGTITAFLFSPDATRLLYGNAGQLGRVAVVDFQTGQAVAFLDGITQATWLDNERLLFIQGFNTPASLSQLSIRTGQTTILIPDATGMALLN